MSNQESTTENGTFQIVAMRVHDEVFGIQIAIINTVITPQPITPVPQTESFVKGVMNLRGKILPVLDLRERFGFSSEPTDCDKNSRIVIVETNGLTAGLIVDEVSEVLTISKSSVEPPSTLLRSLDEKMITGICRTMLSGRGHEPEEGFVLLLDVEAVLTEGLPQYNMDEAVAA
ncbi:MAG: chemotaxis protein CheW [Fimbriimonadaceae bacterium]